MTVNMPVEAINERCIGCPELDIDIRTLEIFGTNPDNEKVPQIVAYQNSLRCTHVDRCRMVVNYRKAEEEKTTPAKKPAAKTTKSKTTPKKTD